jgi:hypothetical protein
MLKPCYSRFRELIPEKPDEITLQAFYHPQTCFLKLTARNDALLAEVVDEADSESGNSMMIQSCDIPDYPEFSKICASRVIIPPTDNLNDDHTCEFQKQVKTSDASIRCFKPAFYLDQIRDRNLCSNFASQPHRLSPNPQTSCNRGL